MSREKNVIVGNNGEKNNDDDDDDEQTIDLDWTTKLFGRSLLDCAKQSPIETRAALDGAETIAVYFTFANVNNDAVVGLLKDLHARLNNKNSSLSTTDRDGQKLKNQQQQQQLQQQEKQQQEKQQQQRRRGRRTTEVVEVVLWAHNDVYGEDLEGSHRDRLVDLPWFAMPFDETELKTRLSRRYRIKSGVPTLVLLDRDGSTISASAQERLLEDPSGASFPWRPRPVDQVLHEVALQRCGHYYQHRDKQYRESHGKNKHVQQQQQQQQQEQQQQMIKRNGGVESLKDGKDGNPGIINKYGDLDGIRGFYFSANWCPPCRAFTPQLAHVYDAIRQGKEKNFEIVFVSSDRSAESYATYVESMPWLAVPFQQTAVRAELAQLYGIRGIPTLILLDGNGHLITMDARQELADDPAALNFPWRPRTVNVLTERYAAKLHDYSAIVLFIDGDETDMQFAESVLKPAADAHYKKHNVANPEHLSATGPHADDKFYEDAIYLQFLVAVDSDAADVLRDLIGLDDVVPLLVAVDLPHNRFAVMEYGVEISVESVNEFVDRFRDGLLACVDIGERSSSTVNNSVTTANRDPPNPPAHEQ